MKKLLLGGMLCMAISMLLASCASDELAEVPTSEVKEVTLTTHFSVGSRAAVEDENLELFYAVYDATDGSVVAKNATGLQAVSTEGNISVTLTLQLEQDKSYDVAFWAQSKGMDCYDLSDLKAIKLRYDRCHSNDPLREAYYGSLFGLRANSQTDVTVALQSPFGKLEVLTTAQDIEAATTVGMWEETMQSSITVSGVADTFNALYGTAEGQAVTATLQARDVPATVRHIEGTEYRVLTSDYLLTHQRATVDVMVTLSYSDIEKTPLVFTAGRAWLNRGETTTLADHYITHPIEFDASVNNWLVADADINL